MVHDVVGDIFVNDLASSKKILRQNRTIIKAIKSKDADQARKCIEDHINFVEKTIKKKGKRKS